MLSLAAEWANYKTTSSEKEKKTQLLVLGRLTFGKPFQSECLHRTCL